MQSNCIIFLTSNHLSPHLRPPCFSVCCKWPSGIQLFATLWTVSLPGSSVHGILQARIQSGLLCPSPGDSLHSGIKPMSLTSPTSTDSSLPLAPPRKSVFITHKYPETLSFGEVNSRSILPSPHLAAWKKFFLYKYQHLRAWLAERWSGKLTWFGNFFLGKEDLAEDTD